MTIKKPLVINQPEVGKLIRELRGITGLTQEQFAASLGITYSTVNRWEKGRAKPSSLAMQKIEGIPISLLRNTDYKSTCIYH
ncbi:helix-turn-helix transcriptional regulator [Nostoc sp. FACHB-973]|nr:helix-turn-helix transcriptional regulator [Nostoc sp. FACHB-973]